VVSLQGEERVEEIARMLSGMAESDTARASARELMARATEFTNQ
jgi:DNA repair ATPase RecN